MSSDAHDVGRVDLTTGARSVGTFGTRK